MAIKWPCEEAIWSIGPYDLEVRVEHVMRAATDGACAYCLYQKIVNAKYQYIF